MSLDCKAFEGKIVPAAHHKTDDQQHVVLPDTHWNDTDGKRIEAHAAGMLQSPTDGRWYWFGESKKLDDSRDPHKYETQGVNCYSAATVAGPWKNEGQVLAQSDIVVPGAKPPWVVQRPKVIHNNETRKFVMYFHLDQPKHKEGGLQSRSDGYQFRRVGTAVAANPAGPYKFVRGFQPDGIPSLDMNLFRDPLDGQAYLIRDCEHQYVGISRLSPDYLNSTGIINKIPVSANLRSGALFCGRLADAAALTTGLRRYGNAQAEQRNLLPHHLAQDW